ncbi:MAG TPA: polysaccharide deacetylase family protein [Nitrospirota bacterium]|nr:polysaccharide deacetylase family protein [Nitrospirota bacterium]
MLLTIQTKQKIKRFIAGTYGLLSHERAGSLSVILNYHSIHPSHETSTRPDDFMRQMGYLKTHFSVISLSDFYTMRTTAKDSPGNIAVVTFDDGYKDNYEYAFPVLKNLGLPATIFLTTGFINGEIDITKECKSYRGLDHLEWSHIKEMREHGIYFGAHTHSHPILTELPLDKAAAEIIQSKQVLEEKLGEPVTHFAYPLGQSGTFNDSIINLLKKHGFDLTCSTIWGTDNDSTSMFALHRIRIDGVDSMEDFIAKVNGHWNFINFIQTRNR